MSHHAAGAVLKVRRSSGAGVDQRELPGHRGALLLMGDVLGQKAEPGRRAGPLRGVAFPPPRQGCARQGCGALMGVAVSRAKLKPLWWRDTFSA